MSDGKAIQKTDRADIQMDVKTTARVVESLVWKTLRGVPYEVSPWDKSEDATSQMTDAVLRY